MPRRTHRPDRPRSRRPVETPRHAMEPTPDALARSLVSRGLASPLILGPIRRRPSDFIPHERTTQ